MPTPKKCSSSVHCAIKEKIARDHEFWVTKAVLDVLMDLGYEEHRGKDIYIIDPFGKASRDTMRVLVSKAFTHFWRLTEIKRDLSLKHLRKTFLTQLAMKLGDKATLVSDHHDMQVLKDHYLNQRKFRSLLHDFTTF